MSQRANVIIARLHDGGHMIIKREKLINRDAKNTYGLVELDNTAINIDASRSVELGFSCDSQLLSTVHDLMSGFDSNKQVDVAVLDFSKAFDVVPHQRLFGKLHHCGIDGLTWA